MKTPAFDIFKCKDSGGVFWVGSAIERPHNSGLCRCHPLSTTGSSKRYAGSNERCRFILLCLYPILIESYRQSLLSLHKTPFLLDYFNLDDDKECIPALGCPPRKLSESLSQHVLNP
jgi:hypothetical protein